MKTLFSIVIALVVFVGLITLMLAINDWGKSAIQLLWALNIVWWAVAYLYYRGENKIGLTE